MDHDEAWHAGRPRTRPHCVTWGPSSPPKKQQPLPTSRLISVVAKRSDGSRRVILCQFNKFSDTFQLDHLRIWWNLHQMLAKHLDETVQNFTIKWQAVSEIMDLDQTLVTPVFDASWTSCNFFPTLVLRNFSLPVFRIYLPICLLCKTSVKCYLLTMLFL